MVTDVRLGPDSPAKTSPEELLRVDGLRVEFNAHGSVVRAVRDATFTVKAGEAVGLVGESGSGKTVSALSVVRLLRPPGRIAAGRVLFRGRDLLMASQREMRRIRGPEIGFVFQDPTTYLNPVLTIGRHITEALIEHMGMDASTARKRALELLDMVELPAARSRLDDHPHQFSGGMRQRIMMAIAISCRPKLLIADEPTTALDVTIQAQILDLLERLRRELGMSVLLITHDMGVIAGIADRVNVMYAGRVVESAGVDDTFHRPSHPYSVGLLKSIPRLDRRTVRALSTIPGQPPDAADPSGGCMFRWRCAYRFGRCDVEDPPLEDVEPGHAVACWAAERVASVGLREPPQLP
jgi:oligopeptide/dipeptide ABC transporter ATP-binding protein